MSEPISRDRQELWRLDNFLSVNGTTKAHHDRRLSLYRYLCETCTHHWSDVSGWGGSPKGTHQCRWCNKVISLDELVALHRVERQVIDGEVEDHQQATR